MKTTNFYKLFTLLFAMIAVASCVQDDEYDVPTAVIESVDIPQSQLLDISGLRSLLEQEIMDTGDLNATLSFETDDDISNDRFVVGYVISNDFSGNFFEELVLQDKASSPTAGIKVLIDANPLSATYEFGRKVFVKLDGLTLGYDSGVLAVGVQDVNSVGKIADAAQRDFLLRDDEVAEIVPLPISIGEFTDLLTNVYVRLTDVQFNRNDRTKTYAGESTDEFDGERRLEQCGSAAILLFNIRTTFSTSTFADFKGITLPAGRGTMDVILTKNFFGEAFNVVINDPSSINFENADACDPETLSCDDGAGGPVTVYTENFEQFDAIEDYEAIGWTNVNIVGGNETWEIGDFSNNNYAQVSGFSSGEPNIDTWLVTPGFNMDGTTNEELNFQIEAAFDNGIGLSVLYATNFTGDVNAANWDFLDVTIPIGPEAGFGGFVQLEPVDLSCVDGTVNIAFRYEGSDQGGVTTRYHLNNIEITGN